MVVYVEMRVGGSSPGLHATPQHCNACPRGVPLILFLAARFSGGTRRSLSLLAIWSDWRAVRRADYGSRASRRGGGAGGGGVVGAGLALLGPYLGDGERPSVRRWSGREPPGSGQGGGRRRVAAGAADRPRRVTPRRCLIVVRCLTSSRMKPRSARNGSCGFGLGWRIALGVRGR